MKLCVFTSPRWKLITIPTANLPGKLVKVNIFITHNLNTCISKVILQNFF